MFASQQRLCGRPRVSDCINARKEKASHNICLMYGGEIAPKPKTDSVAPAQDCPHSAPTASPGSCIYIFPRCRYDWIIIHLHTSVVAKEWLLLPDIILGWYFKLKDSGFIARKGVAEE